VEENPIREIVMTQPLLQVHQLGKRFGGFVVLDGIDFHVQPGERLGLIGPNGSGKSTLVNCLSGVLVNDLGTIDFDGQSLLGLPPHQRAYRGLARSFQIPRPFVRMTVLQNIRVPLMFAAEHRLGRRHSADELDAMALQALDQVGLLSKRDDMAGSLTQIDLRKLELARAIAAQPKLLIADESMAGLATSETDEILALLFRLNEMGIAIIMIEHIMRAVSAFSQRLVVLAAGKKIADGPTDAVLRDPLVERIYLGD
jgi:branched-chain amino acid transport system ATP-binding protein